MTSIGEMRTLVSIEHQGPPGEDQYGGQIPGEWIGDQCWARVQNLKGSETVIASRMGGVQPVVITVRWTPDIAAMTTAWQVRNVELGRAYDIKSVATDERREFIEILAEFQT